MEQSDYVKYICERCRYKFTRKEDSRIALRCPYCSSTELVEDKFDIDQAISEVNDF